MDASPIEYGSLVGMADSAISMAATASANCCWSCWRDDVAPPLVDGAVAARVGCGGSCSGVLGGDSCVVSIGSTRAMRLLLRTTKAVDEARCSVFSARLDDERDDGWR